MPAPQRLVEVVTEVGTGRDEHIYRMKGNEVTQNAAHPSGNHRPRKPKEDRRPVRVREHSEPNPIASAQKTALKRSRTERIERVADTMDLRNIKMLDWILESISPRLKSHVRGEV